MNPRGIAGDINPGLPCYSANLSQTQDLPARQAPKTGLAHLGAWRRSMLSITLPLRRCKRLTGFGASPFSKVNSGLRLRYARAQPGVVRPALTPGRANRDRVPVRLAKTGQNRAKPVPDLIRDPTRCVLQSVSNAKLTQPGTAPDTAGIGEKGAVMVSTP